MNQKIDNTFSQLKIDDALLDDMQIAAYMYDQTFKNSEGKEKPFTPKAFPGKAIRILIPYNDSEIEIYLDSDSYMWDSKCIVDGQFNKLDPDQMEQFFKSDFYAQMTNSLATKWPIKDPKYRKLYNAVVGKQLRVGIIPEDEIEEACKCGMLQEIEHKHDVDQPNKRKDLANKDTTGDGERDYSGSGRRIVHFSDNGVSSKSAQYYCWPRKGKEFKWNSWKEWHKQKPFCKMTFKFNGRRYMISASLFDEQFDNRGFRGGDIDWKPPFGWLTVDECEQITKLSIVREFLKICKKRIKYYLDLTPEEVLAKIDKPEKITIEEIKKTQRVIKHCVDVLFNKGQNDNYKYD